MMLLFGCALLALAAAAPATPAQAQANTCSTFQSGKGVSGTLTAVSGGANGCSAYAQQIGAPVNCEALTGIYTTTQYVCYPLPSGGAACGNIPYQTSATTYSAGTGAIVDKAGSTSTNPQTSYAAAACTVPPPMPTVSVTATPSTVSNGGTAVISWNSTNASSCTSSTITGGTGGATSGTKAETVNTGSGSSKTYSVTCSNVTGSATGSATVTVSNPNTPASCTAWDSTKTPLPGVGVIQTPAGEIPIQNGSTVANTQECINLCKSFADTNGGTYTCGTMSYSTMYALGGTTYGGVGVSQSSHTGCVVNPGANTYPARARTYTSCRLQTGMYELERTFYHPTWTTVKDTFTNSPAAQGCSYDPIYGGSLIFEATQSSWIAAGATTCTSTPTGQPDLTASSITPTTATTGTAVTLSSTIANTGTNTTGAGFQNLFQTATNASGANTTDIGTFNRTTALTAGTSFAATRSHTFASAGTYYVRACADKSSASNNGAIVESNENNNCGPWTAVTVTAPVPPVTGTCSVSPASIATSGSATWTATPSGGNGTYTYSWSGTNSLSGNTQSVTKQYTSTGTKTGSVTITSGGVSSGAITCSNSLTVAAAQSDLTAGPITPTTAIAGTAVTLSATVSNTGAASTGSGFQNLFQRANDASGSGAIDIGTFNRPTALTANNSFSATRSYTFPSVGTFYVRACADKSSASNNGTITESNENNNCGAWTAVTVTSAAVTSCTASPSSLPETGGSVTYTAIGGSAPYTWTPSGGTGSGTGSTRVQTYPATPGPYTMFVRGSTGDQVACTPSPVTVASPVCTNPQATISASPDRVQEGSTTTLTWSASGVGSCTITGPGVNQPAPAASCTVPSASLPTPAITAQSTYTITCDGAVLDQVVVNLTPRFVEF